ncbi:hypothetical protein AB0E59_18650 [Lentzea sp. NPDC034063]|uniref:hypothetical protein n=1 Tax=unclassified Lentzea TaxID=2643253 RepID=UPI0033E4A60E
MKKFSGGKALAVVAVVGGAVLASIAPVMAEVSAQSPSLGAVRVEPTAKVKALGAAVEVDVTYSCPVGQSQSYVYVNVTQSFFIGVASGSGSKVVTCTGGFETVKVTATANPGWPFGVGIAYAKADLNSYPHSASDEKQIWINP